MITDDARWQEVDRHELSGVSDRRCPVNWQKFITDYVGGISDSMVVSDQPYQKVNVKMPWTQFGYLYSKIHSRQSLKLNETEQALTQMLHMKMNTNKLTIILKN